MTNYTYTLDCKFDARKSFYGKATIEVDFDRNEKRLKSYGTLAAVVNMETGKTDVLNLQSSTTTRHVREFLLQEGKEAGTKSQIARMYM